ncbi:SusD-like starch-binding protein associating with outer membrane [Dyadobacter jejuensis]|uniref:SusD-like starch-binding protein associating with outer membrane n=1 Tax=Dyadobacter jejuensis TaxID=1082580 RepID=A0A316APJ6_9BACT|nr:SusD/RagB family nutrient-binding outer membrane lipoprotein [Dyadobacter jejuensis]PWJ59209.1 SusD-like starch-binding protein associating with outer membrane [Dyadobacter jejuensis]
MKKLLVFILPAMLMTACVDSLDDYNIDEKKASSVPAVTLFSSAQKEFTDAIVTPNVNENNFRLYMQQWTTTTYLDEPRYNMTARLIPLNLWSSIYKDVLSDLNEAKKIISEDAILTPAVKTNQLAQVEIMEVMAWSVLVNTFGNVPYSEALDADNSLPKYDDAKTIYDDLLTRLSGALSNIDASAGGFGDGDLFYSGNVAQWKKLGNSLMLKLALVIADSDEAKAKSLVAAAAPNVFTSNADNAAFPYISSPPNYNPVSANLNSLFTSRQDFIPTSVLIDYMNELSDPRRAEFFTTVNGEYKGGEYGFTNTYSAFSHISDKIIDPTLEGIVMDYAEVEFMLAEAVERGFITGDAAMHYEKGVTASITYWGGSAEDASAYLAQPGVAYETAGANYKEKIGMQIWLAYFNRGWDSWLTWRRLDYPQIKAPVVTGLDLKLPVRLIYPHNEPNLNGDNYAVAAQAMGGDLATNKLWWDKF